MDLLKRGFGALTYPGNQTFGASSDANTSFILPYILGVVGVVLVAIIVYVIYQMNKGRPTQTLKGPVDLFAPPSPIVVSRAETKNLMTGSYTLSFYLRADAVPDMRSGATSLLTWPGIWNLDYNAAQEELIWTVKETATTNVQRVTLPKVPLQRWTQVTLAFEGRTMDLYVNGALMKSETLHNLPPAAAASITIVPSGVMGRIALVQVWPRRLTVSEVSANYIDTSDSQGQPTLGPEFFKALTDFSMPNLFCSFRNCKGSQPEAALSQTWEFPYA